jgi:hypothetical protein
MFIKLSLQYNFTIVLVSSHSFNKTNSILLSLLIFSLSVKSISNLALQDKDVTIQIQVHRKWEFRGISDDGPILHV